jgi:hypothetical protein
MNYAQLKGERIVRCDPRWSPLSVPLTGMAEALMAVGCAVPLLAGAGMYFVCGHPRTPENTISHVQKQKYHVERCRTCHNEKCRDYLRGWRAKAKGE